jgi:hypothetical protein
MRRQSERPRKKDSVATIDVTGAEYSIWVCAVQSAGGHGYSLSNSPAICSGTVVITFLPPRRVPHGSTLIGRLFEEGTIASAGIALERAFNVMGERPPGS